MPLSFILKKLVAKLFYPIPICLILLVLGLILVTFTWRHRSGKCLIALGTALLFLFSTDYVGSGLVRKLEYTHPAHLPDASAEGEGGNYSPTYICVLGSGWNSEQRQPITSRTDNPFLDRMLEASRLARVYPRARLLVAMASDGSDVQKRAWLDGWASVVGLDRDRFQLLSNIRDTHTEAMAMQGLVGPHSAILVTSAVHMPRAMKIFTYYNMDVVPAPCGHDTIPRYRNHFHPDHIYPYAANMQRTEAAFYEWMGLAWERFKRLIGR